MNEHLKLVKPDLEMNEKSKKIFEVLSEVMEKVRNNELDNLIVMEDTTSYYSCNQSFLNTSVIRIQQKAMNEL